MKGNSFFQYLLSKDFWKQIRLAAAIFFGILFFVIIFLWFFTRHNSSRPVPDFKGLSKTEAIELADDNSLRIQIADSVFSQEQKPGTIVEQEPKAGVHVKKNRRIFLIINALNPEKVAMPNVIGVSIRQAVAILESNGLFAGHLSYASDIATNNVLRQLFQGKAINPGKKINKGSYINLVLGKNGNYDFAKIPNICGLTLRKAQRIISQESLNTGKIHYDNSVKNSADSLKAFIIKQKPEFTENEQASLGAYVDLWLSVDMKKVKKESKKDE